MGERDFLRVFHGFLEIVQLPRSTLDFSRESAVFFKFKIVVSCQHIKAHTFLKAYDQGYTMRWSTFQLIALSKNADVVKIVNFWTLEVISQVRVRIHHARN